MILPLHFAQLIDDALNHLTLLYSVAIVRDYSGLILALIGSLLYAFQTPGTHVIDSI